ncbi:MAG: cysteine-rich CWC family protein [Bacteroidetes bacterium]|nr:cysteine-rich CWC family protein [Bacteroidota bacterium]MBS1685090.1 cysteine-rich CWC family protein [Bacteroidota bacterium]
MEQLLSRITECPRCHTTFTCRAGDIANCECNTVTLTDVERAYIAERYSDCLCARCIRALQKEVADQDLTSASFE